MHVLDVLDQHVHVPQVACIAAIPATDGYLLQALARVLVRDHVPDLRGVGDLAGGVAADCGGWGGRRIIVIGFVGGGDGRVMVAVVGGSASTASLGCSHPGG